MAEYSKAVKQIIDYGPNNGHKHPMRASPSTIIDCSKRPVPESARWHMRHKPYQMGGDTIGSK